MRNWVWKIGLAALGGLFAACTDSGADSGLAGSSLETENSVALAVQRVDGTPSARTKVLVRPADFVAGANNYAFSNEFVSGDSPVVATDSALGIFNLETDSLGMLSIPKLRSGSYVIEVREEAGRAVASVSVTDSSLDSISVTVSSTGSMTGVVYLPAGMKSAKVGIKGLDYYVETDSLGRFEFANLPEGVFRVVSYVYSTYESLGPDGNPVTFSSYLLLGENTAQVESEKTVQDVTVGQRPAETSPEPADTTGNPEDEVDTTAADTVETYPVVLFEDFEDSTYGWYKSVSQYGIVYTLEAQFDEDREGLVGHFEYQNDSNYNWVLMGRALGRPVDMSDLDSVVFWARGSVPDSAQWISFSFDVLMDSLALDSLGYENGKSWVHLELDTTWRRYVVTPKDLLETDSLKIGANLGWDNVKDHVTNLNFFGGGVGGPFDYWLDDIVIYGVKPWEP